MAEALSPRRHLAKRDVARLIRAEDDLKAQMDDRRSGARAKLGEMWTRLERRHAAERRRDEARIAERARRGRAEGTAQRAKTQFAVRGDRDSGQAFAAAKSVDNITADHDKAIDRETARQTRADNVLERMTRSLGGTPPDKSVALSDPAANTRSGSDEGRSDKTRQPPASSSQSEAERIAARVEELEREQRQRRKRRRPRGKSRRLT
jgi:hypothetical protein